MIYAIYPNGEDLAFPQEKDMTFPIMIPQCKMVSDKTVQVGKKTIHTEKDFNQNESFFYGAYPQTVASSEEAPNLEQHFQNKTLPKTKNSYMYFVKTQKVDVLRPQKCFEYEFNGQRYVRITTDEMHFIHETFTLSNNEKLQSKQTYWVKVEPLKWNLEHPQQQTNLSPTRKAYLSVAPIAGMTYDKIIPFLKRFDREIMQSHDFCNSHSPRKVAENKTGKINSKTQKSKE